MQPPTPLEHANRNRRILRNATLVSLAIGLLFVSQMLCLPVAISHGIWMEQCPSGNMRQSVEVDVEELQRERVGVVKVRVKAHYVVEPFEHILTAFVRLYRTDLLLVYPDGEKTIPLEVEKWSLFAGVQAGEVRLPRVPDGDYLLRTVIQSSIDRQTVDVPLPLYAPSNIHVLTDRPLYEPGNTVQFRAVAFRANDNLPLVLRPGKWVVSDPGGTILMEEEVETDEWGVASSSFPLDPLAESGPWSVRFESGSDSQTLPFTVEPFTLPRFEVDAQGSAPFFTAGDTPTITGRATYSSGAPVAGADVVVTWRIQGDWPPPTNWLEDNFPNTAQTDSTGAFRLVLPTIPDDLQDTVTLRAILRVTDATGDSQAQSVSVLLSEDRIHADAITDMDEGLIAGFNNRMFVRVTTPNGTPVANTELVVRRAWDATDEGKRAQTDADGVARLQIDPGPPVNVIIPPPPVRPPAIKPSVTVTGAQDLITEQGAPLADRLRLTTQLDALEGCALHVLDGSKSITTLLSINPAGRIDAAMAGEDVLERCVTGVLSAQRMAPGEQRLLSVEYTFRAPDQPKLNMTTEAPLGMPSGLLGILRAHRNEARACLPADSPSTPVDGALVWSARADQQRVSLQWIPTARQTRLDATSTACVRRTMLQAVQLSKPADEDVMGTMHFDVQEAERIRQRRPEPTIMRGYELLVTAQRTDGDAIGETTLRMTPATLPRLRIRAEPVVASAGEAVTFTFVRGDGFDQEWPETVQLQGQQGAEMETDFHTEDRTATFTLPEDAEGWYTLSWSDVSSRIFVPDRDELTLSMHTERQQYRPKDAVTIHVQTSQQANVGLFGVDESLALLTPLPGPDVLTNDVLLPPESDPAFDGIDAQALMMGRIQGVHAAEAVILRTNHIPALPERDVPVSQSAAVSFDPTLDLIDGFYTVLAELHVQTQNWEQQTPPEVQMDNAQMAALWMKAIAACDARGEPTTDAFGRRLKLHRLPPDLLAMTDPRAVLVDGTRLPEDVDSWDRWVAEEGQ